MRFAIVLVPEAVEDLRLLKAGLRAGRDTKLEDL